jgi:dihydrofolate synthase/folylpolyglutamate synthase
MDHFRHLAVRRLAPIVSEAEFERFVGEFTNYERMKEYRYDEETLGLRRMADLMVALGDPQNRYPSIHIAGTKGKGATSLMLEALLAASGLAVGTYISPHVESIRERIRFGGQPISAAELCALTNRILPVISARWESDPAGFPTFFELMTALAMLHFFDRRASVGIFEVGLGGRLDATNILRPRWTAITSIGLEHTDKLGDTLALIAREKAGIVKPSTPLVAGPLSAEAEAVILAIARDRRAPVTAADPGAVRRSGPGAIEVASGLLPFPAASVPAGAVRGPALRDDLAMALILWKGFLATAGVDPSLAALEAALGALRLPARVEVFGGRPEVVIDGAHTPESVRALRQALEEEGFPRPRALVLALAADKPLDPILRELEGLAEEAFFTRADPARGRDPEDIAARFREISGAPASSVEDPEEAFERASAGGRAVVVTGSFYLAGRLRGILRQDAGILRQDAAF